MNKNDSQFESFLHEFAPRDPGPLPAGTHAHLWRRLAAAAVILAGGASLWFASHSSREESLPAMQSTRILQPEAASPAPRLSLLELTQLAQSDPKKLASALDADSRRILPGFTGNHSTLSVLAKE
jgi:hypothetical protein